MGTFETPRRPHAAAAMRIAAVFPALGTMLRSVVTYFTAARRARRIAQSLDQLSDYQLKDLGLTRSDIHRLAHMRLDARSDD